MKLQNAIDGRHSIREFEKKKVPQKVLRDLIKNATKAPSAANLQPWRFYIVSSKSKRDFIAQETKKKFEVILKTRNLKQANMKTRKIQKIAKKFYENLGDAPHIILAYRQKERKEESYVLPCDISSISAAVQNLMLSAVEKGLGTCWVGTINGFEKKLNRFLGIPSNQELVASVLVGYPKIDSKILLRKKKSLNEVMKFI